MDRKVLNAVNTASREREALKQAIKDIMPSAVNEAGIDFIELKKILGEDIIGDNERFGLQWAGKDDARKLLQEDINLTLKLKEEASLNPQNTNNVIIEGENLAVLRLLQKSYYNKVKMIYIDPPYNTGKDFVYKDSFGETEKNYLNYTGQLDDEGKRTHTNTESTGRKHTNWLNMMYPRLYLARSLLKEDGVIFVSIDDNEVHHLRMLMDSIFGEENFVAELIWRKKTGSSDSSAIAVITEYIIVYIKNDTYKKNSFFLDKNAHDEERYSLSDEYLNKRGKYYIDNLDRGSLGYVESLDFGILAPDGTLVFPNGRSAKKK